MSTFINIDILKPPLFLPFMIKESIIIIVEQNMEDYAILLLYIIY
jgi:hypothetical protein